MTVVEDLELLDRSIRQLQIEWDKFFGGVERKPPMDLRSKVEGLIRKYAYSEMRNSAERFRYQGLVSRYSTFNELWNKRMRALEEGRPVAPGLPRPAPPPPPAAPDAAARTAAAAAKAGEFRVRDPQADTAAVRDLFDRFLQARQSAGEKGTVKFDSFQKLIGQQAAKILAEKGARAVDFRLETKDGKVSLKARPVK